MDATWLSANELAALTGKSRQNAHKAMKRALRGGTWLNCSIAVRLAKGRSGGGRSGLRYEVLLQSLPLHIQAAFSGVSEPSQTRLRKRPAATEAREKDPSTYPLAKQRYGVIENAVSYPAGSVERAAAVRAAVRPGASQRSIERWIDAFEREGMVGLMRTRPANAGKPRVIVTAEFDAAYIQAGYDPAELPGLARFLDTIIKSLWASQAANAGFRARSVIAELWRCDPLRVSWICPHWPNTSSVVLYRVSQERTLH